MGVRVAGKMIPLSRVKNWLNSSVTAVMAAVRFAGIVGVERRLSVTVVTL